MVIYILSQIWRHGGIIERLENGKLHIKHAANIPKTTLSAAEATFEQIDQYIRTVEGLDAPSTTLWKMIVTLAGWQRNERISQFLNGDEEALNMFFSYQAKLAQSGWNDVYSNWMEYETPESEQLKQEIYKRALDYFKR